MQQAARALGSRYRLERILGSGAMGEVWLAHDRVSGAAVAAKVLRPELAADPVLVGRFVQERSILLGLDHPHIVRVHDLVVEGDQLAIVMDLVSGPDLRRRLAAVGAFAPYDAAAMTADILDALAVAHDSGVLHRDVKPDNVLIDDRAPTFVRLSDFGIARLAQQTTVRMTGVLGTAEYLAPEILTAETVSATADVYAAGVVLQELLTGRTPFAGGGNAYAIAHRHVTAAPPPIVGAPPALQELVTAMLGKDPRSRPPASAAAAALRTLLPTLSGLAALPPAVAPAAGPTPDAGCAAVAVRGYRPDDAVVDPQRTLLRAAQAQRAANAGVGPEAGDVAPALPVAAAEAVAGQQTKLRNPRPARPVVDVPDLDAPVDPGRSHRRSRRRTTLLVAAGAGTALAVAGLLLAFLAGGSPHRSRSVTTTAGQQPIDSTAAPQQFPTGLSVLRQASYAPGQASLTVTLTYTIGAAPLAGPLFESLPASSPGSPCPEASWSKVAAARDTTTGIGAASCGWRLDTGALPAGSSTVVSASVPWQPAANTSVSSQLAAGLAAEAAATDATLGHLPQTPAYAVQRLQALAVSVQLPVHVQSRLAVAVLPIWTGADSPDQLNPLYTSSAPQPTALDAQLGGAIALSSDTCSGSIGITARQPYANTQASGCTLTARLGELTGQSTPFDITNNAG